MIATPINIYMSLNRNLSQKSLDESWPENKYFFAMILIRTKYFLCDRICSLHISTKVFLLNILSCVRWSWLKSFCFLFGCKRTWPKIQNWPNLTKEIYKIIIPRLIFLWISPQSCPEYEFVHQPCVRCVASGSPSPVGGSLRILWVRIPQLQSLAFLLPLLQGLCGWFLWRRLRYVYRRDRFYTPL